MSPEWSAWILSVLQLLQHMVLATLIIVIVGWLLSWLLP